MIWAPFEKSPNCASHNVSVWGIGDAVAVVESEHAEFAERAVVDTELRLILRHVLQRDVTLAVFEIVERKMALTECAAPGILAAQAHRDSLKNEASECDGFGEGPVDRSIFSEGFAALLHESVELGMNVKRGRQECDTVNHLLQHVARDCGGRDLARGRNGGIEHPRSGGLVGIKSGVQAIGNPLPAGFHFSGSQNLCSGKLLAVQHSGRRMLFDFPIHDRLRVSRIVAFVVAVAAVADHVDDHIALELLAVIEGQAKHAQGGFGIVAIHVKNRRLNHARNVRCIGGGSGIFRQGGKADLVVDYEVQRATGAIAFELRQVQGLRNDALTRERGVAVDEERNHAPALLVGETLLLGTHHALDDRIDRFQVAWVGGERDHNLVGRTAPCELHCAPRWYLTSPEPWAEAGSILPSNSEKIWPRGLQMTLARTFRRPRCAMPMTIS